MKFQIVVLIVSFFAATQAIAGNCDTSSLFTYANYAKSTLCTGASVCGGGQCVVCILSFEPWASSGITGVKACFTQEITDLATGGVTSNTTCPTTIGICAVGAGPNSGAPMANQSAVRGSKPLQVCGSIVQAENQAVGESIPIVGGHFSLNYFTHWVLGKVGDYKITIPLSEGTLNTSISDFDIKIKINGVLVANDNRLNNLATASYSYTWDGNVGGVPTIGSQTAEVEVVSNTSVVNIPVFSSVKVGSLKSELLGLGGWLPSIYAFYDENSGTLYKGDGSRRVVTRSTISGGYYVAEEDASLVYYFDTTGRLLNIKTGLLGTVKYTFNYNTQGQLTSIDEPFSQTTTFNRNSGGDFVSITAPNGQTTSVLLSTSGYLASVTNPNSETYSMTYYSDGLLATFQKPGAQISTFTFDSDGNLTRDAHSGGYFFDIVKNTNPSKTADITLTSKMGRQTTSLMTETADRIQSTRTLPNGKQIGNDLRLYSGYSTESKTSFGETTNTTLTDDLRFGAMSKFETSYQYSNGVAYYTISKTPSVTLSSSSDPFSILTYSVNFQKGSNTSTVTFNPSTKVFAGNTSIGRTSETEIDVYERPVSIKTGNLTKTEISYASDKVSQIKQGVRQTDFTYNSTTGFLENITNPLSQVTVFVSDTAGRVTGKILPDLRSVSFGYDANGNLTSVTPPGRAAHSFNLNSSELIDAYQPPTLTGVATTATTYTYNNDKQLTQVLKPNGSSISYSYNASTGVLESLTTPSDVVNFYMDSVNGLPWRIQSTTGSAMNTFIYYYGTTPYQVSTRDGAFSFMNTYSKNFSTNGTIGSDVVSTNAGSKSVSYTYDNDELLTGAGDLTLTNDTPNGMLSATSIGITPNIVTDAYTYNSFGEVTGYQAKYGTTVIYDLTLGRDGMGRINSKTQVMNSVTDAYDYTFDTTGRLTQTDKNSTTVATYGYDDNSNRDSGTIGSQPTTATYDAQDRMTAYNLLTFTYNANGDLTSKTSTLTSTTTNYVYDVFGNLTSVTLPSSTVISYEVDGLNRRIGKKVNGTLQTRWVYMDQTRIAAEIDSSGNITKRFVYASKSNIPDYMTMGGNNYRIISDHLGSPRLVVKVSDGSVAGMMDHDEFGRVLADTNPGLLPFGFAGGLYDADTGLVRFGARDFDSETGRWTSKDPILFNGGDTNLFGYTFQDPVNWIDPSGLKILYGDDKSKKIFDALMKGKLSGPQRALIDQLQKPGFDVTISTGQKVGSGHIAETGKGKCGGAEINFGKILSGDDMWNAGILMHELVHAGQIQRGILPGLPSSEDEGYASQKEFFNLNGLSILGN